MTPTQFDLLLYLARHPGRLVTHHMIASAVWGSAENLEAPNLRVFISQLRRKIEEDPRRPRLIATELGIGYRFSPDGGRPTGGPR